MSLKVVKALQLSTFVRYLFGMCPYYIQMDSEDPRKMAQITLLSAYLPLVGGFATALLLYLGIEPLVIHGKGNPIEDAHSLGFFYTQSTRINHFIITFQIIGSICSYFIILVQFRTEEQIRN